ncbi:alanine--glyoxylate aminotransferase family protein [Dokdonella sp.]|uniref:pyridoxal-phosphate-dependent aminotransferase family protein n=1 Tax=Dokdonella sp. TaxID=2291710 RepID=UPI002636D97D|nr:alanine--glyoxylate aminotransferase family protein [Dokdonella sp.]
MPPFRSFQPPARLLLGPGPSPVPRRILDALARPTIGHLDPAFIGMMDEVKALLRYAFRTENAVTLPVSAPGSAGMEAAFVNLVEPGDTVIVCRNGVFGGRMRENVVRLGATAVMVDDPFGSPVDPGKVEAALKANPGARALAFVHAETSTGAMSDAAVLCRLAREHGALSLVDAVTSLGGIPVEVDAWGADAIYSGSQKCLAAPPGLAPLSFGEAAVAALKARRTPVQSWFLDLGLVIDYWQGSGARAYHHTAPINMLYALHEALLMLHEEGLEVAWARHRANHLRLRDGLAALDLELFVEESARLPQLNAVKVPAGVDEAGVRRRLLDEHGIEIGAGLGELAGRIWRIGLMGAGSAPQNVDRVLEALGKVLGRTAA